MIASAQPPKNVLVTLNVGQQRSKAGKAYNVYEIVTPTGTFSSSDNQPQQTTQPTMQVNTQATVQADPTEALEREKRLMDWCVKAIDNITRYVSDTSKEYYESLDKTALIQSLHVHVRSKSIYPTDIKDEIDEGMSAEDKFEQGNMPIPEAKDIHGYDPGAVPF